MELCTFVLGVAFGLCGRSLKSNRDIRCFWCPHMLCSGDLRVRIPHACLFPFLCQVFFHTRLQIYVRSQRSSCDSPVLPFSALGYLWTDAPSQLFLQNFLWEDCMFQNFDSHLTHIWFSFLFRQTDFRWHIFFSILVQILILCLIS